MIFDGPNRRIILEASDGDTIVMADVYSRWKDWVLLEDGAAYPPAFTTVGGEPLGGGLFAGVYFFLDTAAGWLIRPREANHVLTITGNLFPSVAGAPVFASTAGSFQVQIRLQTSALTQIASGGDAPSIASAVWAHALSGVSAGDALTRTTPTAEGAVVADAGNTRSSFKTNLTESVTGFWEHALVSISSGVMRGQVRKVLSYNGTTKVLTVGPAPGFTAVPADGVTFVLVNR
jgi:hypothetical protein